GEDRVVGQHEEGDALVAQRADELLGAGDRVLLPHEDAVHVGEPGVHGAGFGHRPIVGHPLSSRWSSPGRGPGGSARAGRPPRPRRAGSGPATWAATTPCSTTGCTS